MAKGQKGDTVSMASDVMDDGSVYKQKEQKDGYGIVTLYSSHETACLWPGEETRTDVGTGDPSRIP
jgi:hypothetical protein